MSHAIKFAGETCVEIEVQVQRARGSMGSIVIMIDRQSSSGNVGISWSGVAALSIAGVQAFIEALQAAQETARTMAEGPVQ